MSVFAFWAAGAVRMNSKDAFNGASTVSWAMDDAGRMTSAATRMFLNGSRRSTGAEFCVRTGACSSGAMPAKKVSPFVQVRADVSTRHDEGARLTSM